MDNSALAPYFKILAPTSEQKPTLTLKDQTLIPFIFDILCRRSHHHLALTNSSSEIYTKVFLDLIAQRLANDETPAILRSAAFIYLDLNSLLLTSAQSVATAQEFSNICRKLESTYSLIILAINQVESLLSDEKHLLGNRLRGLLVNDHWRVMVTTTSIHQKNMLQFSSLNNFFVTANLSEPNKTDALLILKIFRDELENSHQVIIPDEALSYALTMANQYLNGQQTSLDQALHLINSGAARINQIKDEQENKPILANTILMQIVSHRTQIPLIKLQNNKPNAADFIQYMKNHIYGQETAINLIVSLLQHARLKLQENKKGPLSNILLIGPDNVGKATTACALAEYLFGRKKSLLRINLDDTLHPASLADIHVTTQSEELFSASLLEAIQQSPYAIVLFENINQASADTLALFQNIFTVGYATDQQGNFYDFRHAIIIMTTTLGSEHIISSQSKTSSEPYQSGDLMQLILNNLHTNEPTSIPPPSQEFGEELRPALEAFFSPKLLASFHLVPFIALDHTALEKIMRQQLKTLSKHLESQYEIELSYAPEVLRFLVQVVLEHTGLTTNINKILDQYLYPCIASRLAKEDRNRSKRLLLQLNDTGHILHCEFVSANGALSYKL